MSKTIQQIADEIKAEMKEKWAVEDSSKVCTPTANSGTNVSTIPLSTPIQLNTVIKWEIPCQLCPSCMARLQGASPQVVSAWTNLAKGTKKKPPKQPKIADEKEIEDTEVI